MAKIVPGVYVTQKSGELAVAAPFGLNVVGIVGTASRGTIDEAVLCNAIQDVYKIYGYPDVYDSTSEGTELSLSRAAAIAYDAGAQAVQCVRVGSSSAAKSSRFIDTTSGYAAELLAQSEGTWGNEIKYKVENADGVTATEGHVAAHSAYYEVSYTDAREGTDPWSGEPFPYLSVTHVPTFVAEASAGNSISVQYSAGTGTEVTMKIIHSDSFVFKETSEDDGDVVDAENTKQASQTFTTRDACTIEGVYLRLKYGVVPDPLASSLKVELFAVDSDHKPTGSALATGTDTFTNLALTSSYTTETIAFSSSYALVADTEYAIVLSWSGTYTSGDFTIAGLEAPTATPTFTRGYCWWSTDTGSTWAASSTTETILFYPDLTVSEGYCVFVTNAWGTAWPSGNTGDKYIIWSGTSTPLDNTYVDVKFYTATSMLVTIKYGDLEEKYWVIDGYDLIADVNFSSTIIEAITPSSSDQRVEYPIITVGEWQYFGLGAGTSGHDGATDVAASDYETGFAALETVNAHVITAAGRKDQAVISKLLAHVKNASDNKRERIAVAGHGFGLALADVLTSNGAYADKRLVWVTPGVKRTNPDGGDQEELSAAYMANYAAGWLAANDPSLSILYKTVNVEGLETLYTEQEVEQIVQRRMICVNQLTEGGIRWRDSINTTLETDWREIIVVRIVDYATHGQRSICNGFVGRKNLSSQRAAIQTVIERFFEGMKNAAMLDDSDDAYSVDVKMPDRLTVRVLTTFKPVGTIKFIEIENTIR